MELYLQKERIGHFYFLHTSTLGITIELYAIYIETGREMIKSNQDRIAPTCGGFGVRV